MTKLFGALYVIVSSFFFFGCDSPKKVSEPVAKSLAQTSGSGGQILWGRQPYPGRYLFGVCQGTQAVLVSVSGTAEKPEVAQMKTEETGNSVCGERAEFWMRYDRAVGKPNGIRSLEAMGNLMAIMEESEKEEKKQ